MIHAFHEIHFANLTVSEFLKEDQKALEAVADFQILEDHMKDFLENENVLSEQERIMEYVLYPAFVRWLREIQNTFKPFIVH